MEQSKSNMFLMMNSKSFPSDKLRFMKAKLDELDENTFFMVQSIDYKEPNSLLIVSIFAGQLGIDRFMLGETGVGVAKLLTCGGFFVWWIIDLFLIVEATKEVNFQKFMQASASNGIAW